MCCEKDRLKEFLYRNRLKQVDLVNYLGITKGFMSLVLSGKKSLSEENKGKLLDNPYGWDVSMLKDREEEHKEMTEDKGVIELLKEQNAELQAKIDMLNREIGELTALLKSEKQKNAQLAESSSSANVG